MHRIGLVIFIITLSSVQLDLEVAIRIHTLNTGLPLALGRPTLPLHLCKTYNAARLLLL